MQHSFYFCLVLYVMINWDVLFWFIDTVQIDELLHNLCLKVLKAIRFLISSLLRVLRGAGRINVSGDLWYVYETKMKVMYEITHLIYFLLKMLSVCFVYCFWKNVDWGQDDKWDKVVVKSTICTYYILPIHKSYRLFSSVKSNNLYFTLATRPHRNFSLFCRKHWLYCPWNAQTSCDPQCY